jgi:hypothetical protein
VDVLFLAVEAVLLPLAAPEVFFETVVFLPAVVFLAEELADPLPLLFLPAEVLVFGIVVSLLTRFHSISDFLLIW